MSSGTIKTDSYSSISNNPQYRLSNNTPFTVPSDGYVKITVAGVFHIFNSNANTYAPLCVNRPNGGQMWICFFLKKGLKVRWNADDGSSDVEFYRCV